MRKLLLLLTLLPMAMFAEPVNFGGLREGDMIETNGVPPSRTITINNVVGSLGTNLAFTVEGGGGGEEADPIAYPIATNALAIAEGALPATLIDDYKWRITGSMLFTDPMQPDRVFVGPFRLSFMSPDGDVILNRDGGFSSGGFSGAIRWLWPDTDSFSPLIKRDELEESTITLLPKSGGTLTGGLTLAPAGITYQVTGTNLNYTIRAEYDGTNINLNVYEVTR